MYLCRGCRKKVKNDVMINAAIDTLTDLIGKTPAILHQMDIAEFEAKSDPGKWSRKEILGHLIDSASNNHHRFIRVQYEPVPTISYDQNKWNELNQYQHLDSKHVINLWLIYNQHLLEVIKRIPDEHLLMEYDTGGAKNVTLQYLIEDYVTHLEHHLKQIVN
jgi:DinB family protein